MRYTRYARNPRIARVLTDFGWVRELNEGVNRIYDEMKNFYLQDPEYSEPNSHSVQLELENNYKSRQLRIEDHVDELGEKINSENLNENEREILAYLYNNERINVGITSELIGRSDVTSRKLLKSLLNKGVLKWHGNSKNDPTQYYTLYKE